MNGEFLPKVDPQGIIKTKDKMHATHYYTQSNKQGGKDSNTWANSSG